MKESGWPSLSSVAFTSTATRMLDLLGHSHHALRMPFPLSLRKSAIVLKSGFVSVDGRPMITNGVYVVYSDDSGRRWQVLDIGCDELPKWVKAAYPPYDGHPTFEAGTLDILATTN